MIQNILLTNLPSFLVDVLGKIPSQEDLPFVVLPRDTPEGGELMALMKDYQRECQTRKARALKYGTDYKQLAPQDFLPWTKAKRLRENPEKGFISGIDLMDTHELAKQDARKARFGDVPTTDVKVMSGTHIQEHGGDPLSEEAVTLPVEQAWDTEKLLRPLRRDPPSYLWKSASRGEASANSDPFVMQKTVKGDMGTQKASFVVHRLGGLQADSQQRHHVIFQRLRSFLR